MTFIDTSVLCELIRVPGKNQQAEAVRGEFGQRIDDGERFVLPITAVIETGNHIAQADGPRREAAQRLVALLRSAMADETPFVLNQVTWDEDFLDALCKGNATHQTFVDLAGNGLMGAGDVAILVERDQFVAGSAYSATDVRVWTLERVLGAYA